MPRPSEDELIARYFAPLAGMGGLGLLDDAAVISPAAGRDLVLTKDALVAGVHFFPDDPPGDIARKALRVNLSDLAAKGAAPLGFLLALALPGGWSEDWLADFADGLGADAERYAIPLLGGDTVKTPGPLTISITALGEVPAGAMVRRTGVRPGDWLYVSGAIGDSALGLRLRLAAPADRIWADHMQAADRDFLLDRYLLPQPRLALAPALRAHATGAMDVSDGFAGDLAKMLRASGCGAIVRIAQTPFSRAGGAACELHAENRKVCLTGGDDYEIICAVVPRDASAFEAAATLAGVPVRRVGEALDGAQILFVDQDGEIRDFAAGSYSHF